MSVDDRPTGRLPGPMRLITGKKRWEELTTMDLLTATRRCVRDAEQDAREGNRKRCLDHLQDAVDLLSDVRSDIEDGICTVSPHEETQYEATEGTA